jgi:hypothetical protein
MMVLVRIVATGSAPRALVVERPRWYEWFLGASQREWAAYGVERIVRYGGCSETEWVWYRDSRDHQPVRVPRGIEVELENARERAEALAAVAARAGWRRP